MADQDYERAPGVSVDRTPAAFDAFTGTAGDLIAAGLLKPHQLEPQVGRRKGRTTFFPDGAPVPQHMRGAPREEGYTVVERLAGQRVCVKVWVSKDEWRRRCRAHLAAAPAVVFEAGEGSKWFHGARERLLEAGVPERWLADLPRPGRRWDKRVLVEDGWHVRVEVYSSGLVWVAAFKRHRAREAPAPRLRLIWSDGRPV